jgi:hypothetical protein
MNQFRLSGVGSRRPTKKMGNKNTKIKNLDCCHLLTGGITMATTMEYAMVSGQFDDADELSIESDLVRENLPELAKLAIEGNIVREKLPERAKLAIESDLVRETLPESAYDDNYDDDDDDDDDEMYYYDADDNPISSNSATQMAAGFTSGKKMNFTHSVGNAVSKMQELETKKRTLHTSRDDRATSEQCLDPRTRLMLFKMLSNGMLELIDGCLSTGKEANVYYAKAGRKSNTDITEFAIKIYKTSILVFKDRDKYVSGEHRWRKGYCEYCSCIIASLLCTLYAVLTMECFAR